VSDFVHRGVVEGFYGTPWPHEDRLWMLERLGRWGMNRYVHAPKDDPLHRQRWREPYPDEAMREFAALVECGMRHGVEVGFAVSPGLSIHYASAEDRAALVAKLAGFRALGSRFATLALDDVPSTLVHDEDLRAFSSLAAAHVELAHAVQEGLGPDVTLWLVPTDYLGVEATDYLEELGADLDGAIEIGWTGRTVVSPTVRTEEAAARAATLCRRVLLWDNTPVADGPMRPMLHLGPYTGRAADLHRHATGLLLNPMQQARASAITLHTAARYMADPAGYDAESAWHEAVAELGAGAAEPFARFARAHRFSALAPDDRDAALEAAIGELRAALAGERETSPALDALRELLAKRAAATPSVRDELADRRLAAELEPWLAAHACETRRMQAATDFLRTCLGDTPLAAKTLAFFAMEGRLSRESSPARASYGPRRVLYPQLASMREDSMAFGADPALYVGRCLADELVGLAEDVALRRLRGPARPHPA
jgi:hyaluronoglucosaminidase